MNILITGGAGFIGSSLVSRLRSTGNNLVIVDRLSDYYSITYKKARLNSQFGQVSHIFIEDDINQDKFYESLSNFEFDTVIHLAAQPGVRVKFQGQ